MYRRTIHLNDSSSSEAGAGKRFPITRTVILCSAAYIALADNVVAEDLIINGSGIFSGALTAAGALTASTVNTTNSITAGNAAVGGNLGVAGQTNLTQVSVAGALKANGLLEVSGATTLQDVSIKNANVSDTLTAHGAVEVHGALTANGTTKLASVTMSDGRVSSDLTVEGVLNVAGSSIFTGAVSVSGPTNLNGPVTADTLAANSLVVTGATTMNAAFVKDDLSVEGDATFASLEADRIVANDLRLKGDLTVEGTMILPQKFSLEQVDVSGDTNLNNLNVTGTTQMNAGSSLLRLSEEGLAVNVDGKSELTVTAEGAAMRSGASRVQVNDNGTADVIASKAATVRGGETQLKLDGTGARFSGSDGTAVRVRGVADGIDRNDAVNMGQFNEGVSKLSSGVAMSMALSQLPTPAPGSNYSFGVALGAFNEEAAFALGGTAILDGGVTLRGGLSHSNGDLGAGIGMGWSF